MKVTTVEEIRELDRRATADHCVPPLILMENAGNAAFHVLLREVGVEGKSFGVLCGSGNNGGDGLVVARKLHSSGAQVKVILLCDPGSYRGSAETNFEMLAQSGCQVESQPSPVAIREAIAHCDVVVDALLGTGLTGDVKGSFEAAIEEINASSAITLSLDIPSGVDGNTGQVQTVAVCADYTVTFGLPKRGNFLYPGAGLAGRLFVSHISFPPSLYRTSTVEVSLNDPPALPKRRVDGHKGTFGDTLFIAGAASYFGAPALAALAMLKAGGGCSRLATPRSVVPAIATVGPEIVFTPLEETASGSLALSNRDRLLELSDQVDFVVVGPGLSLDGETQALTRRLISGIDKPLLLDGDGLAAIEQQPEVVRKRPYPTILTPHAGEMSRIAGVPIRDLKRDPIGVLQSVAQDVDSVVVLKGAHSLIGFPDRRVFVNTSGNSGMASAGSGDVLTGTIAAMFGLGLPFDEAIKVGVFVHGFAGDLAALERGEDGITARDVLEYLPSATKAYRRDHATLARTFYNSVKVV